MKLSDGLGARQEVPAEGEVAPGEPIALADEVDAERPVEINRHSISRRIGRSVAALTGVGGLDLHRGEAALKDIIVFLPGWEAHFLGQEGSTNCGTITL